jgi:hypothetical protein
LYTKISYHAVDAHTKKQRRLGEALGPTSREEAEKLVADYLRTHKITNVRWKWNDDVSSRRAHFAVFQPIRQILCPHAAILFLGQQPLPIRLFLGLAVGNLMIPHDESPSNRA